MQYFHLCVCCTELSGNGPNGSQYTAGLIKFALSVNREVVLVLTIKVYVGMTIGCRGNTLHYQHVLLYYQSSMSTQNRVVFVALLLATS
jgi:hypothetical protein